MSALVRVAIPQSVAEIPVVQGEAAHAVIEAAAGTGKTYTIERLVARILVETNTTIDQLLIVTYTEAATRELRERIRGFLRRLSDATESDADPTEAHIALDALARRRVRRALHDFDSASIRTIHGFCNRVLSELAIDTGMPFDIELVDESVAVQQAFREVLRTALATDPEVRESVAELLSVMRLTDFTELLQAGRAHEYLRYGWRVTSEVREAIGTLLDNTDWERFYDAARNKDGSVAKAALPHFESTTPWREGAFATRDDAIDAVLADAGDCLFGTALTNAGKLRSPFNKSEWHVEWFRHGQHLVSALPQLIGMLLEVLLPITVAQLETVQQREGQIDYFDMLHRVRDAIEGPSGTRLRRTLRQRFRFVLVDEFQDTDPIQWGIFRDVFAQRDDGSLYVVGDRKQAIYGFRGADFSTYVEAIETLIDRHAAARVDLDTNFRSTPALIEAYNAILDQQAELPFFGGRFVRYDVPVKAPDTADSVLDDEAPITIFYAPPIDDDDSEERRKIGELRRDLGRMYANEMRALVSENGLTVSEGGVARRATWSDIMVLCPTHSDLSQLSAWLDESAVPYVRPRRGTIFEGLEALWLRDLLAAIEAPTSRGRRLLAWMTPFFGERLDDIDALAEVDTNDPRWSLLLHWSRLAAESRWPELFASLLNDSGYVDRQVVLANTQSLSVMRALCDVLVTESSKRALTIADLLEELDRWIGGTDTPAGATIDVPNDVDSNAVQLITAHSAKGLEAPVIFIYGGFGGRRGGRGLHRIRLDEEQKRVVVPSDQTSEIITEVIRHDEERARERLCYVAITRPRQRLYLVAADPNALGSRSRIDGTYTPLNQRLVQMIDDGDIAKRPDLFRVVEIRDELLPYNSNSVDVRSWVPRLNPAPMPAVRAESQSRAAACASFHSYSSLKKRVPTESPEAVLIEPIDEREAREDDIDTGKPDTGDSGASAATDAVTGSRASIPGGPEMGNCLHDLIEHTDATALLKANNAADWLDSGEIRKWVNERLRYYGFPEDLADEIAPMVFGALRNPVPCGPWLAPTHRIEGGFATGEIFPELEFVFPLVDVWSNAHIKGFVDVCYRNGERFGFADWKSDRLPSYSESDMEEHVLQRYGLQRKLYTLAMLRLLRIETDAEYEARFDGFQYVFLRGLNTEGTGGMYHDRPDWDLVRSWQEEVRGYFTASRTSAEEAR